MASSMLTGERRWTSTRKSGMTVLGKVPKPINLPSQKMENHGLDPNVEIVPKGALTWGARPSLASSNAWGSSTLSSPRADGGTGSPTHANGRPLSGGSGTRPSTGSSERSSEPSAVSWCSSSRPSSASGIVPTSHVLLAANRPRSAETRPNSSQLSRFAESSADGIAWGAPGTSEKVASEGTKRRDFTLSSGDFPSLGSEKIDEPKIQGQSPKVHASESSLPLSSKGIPAPHLNSGYANSGPVVNENFNSWSADSSSHTGKDASRTEKWHNDNHHMQPLLDANMSARQFASWHGPPGHSPNVVWYGGHEAGGPYRPFGPQGSYHVDPYYPYVPAGAVPNAQAFSRPEAIPSGMHFNKREVLRHMPSEAYIAHNQSGIPVRPGVYPGQVLYEGFHGSPRAGFDNSSEQDVSMKGMAGQYTFHNQHLPDNSRLQPWRFHTQPDGCASAMTQKQIISDQANATQGQYKVLLKQHGNQEEEHTVTVWPTSQGGKQPSFLTPEVDLVNSYKQEQATDKQHSEDSRSQHSDDLVDHSNGNSKSMGHVVLKKSNTESVPIKDQHNANLKKNASLMEKVECLNSKTRTVDVHFEVETIPSEKMKSNQTSKNNADHFENVGPTDLSSASNTPISDPRNVSTSLLSTSTKVILHESAIESKPNPHQSDELAVLPDNSSEDVGHSKSRNQKRIRSMKAGVDHHYGKLKFGSYGANEMNGTSEQDSLEKTSVAVGTSGPLLSILGSHASQNISVSEPPSLELVDVQHSKLKELARQRAVELQNKELERIAEQKAKAQAKLDELNRRTSASSKQNSRHAQQPFNDTISGKNAKTSAVINETPYGSLSCDFQTKSKENDESIGDLAVSSFTEPSRASGSSVQVSPSTGEQSWPLGQEITSQINIGTTTPDIQNEVVSRRKQAGYRRRRNVTDVHNQSEGIINPDSSGNSTSASNVFEDSSVVPGNLNHEYSTSHPNNKNNRGSKYKASLSDTHHSSPLPSSAPLEGASEKYVVDQNETKPQVKPVEQMTEKNSDGIMGRQDSFDLTVVPNQEGSEPCQVTSERSSIKWKPHSHRKPMRNLQSDKANVKYQASDTVVWAPVKQVNKNGSSEQVHNSSSSQVTNLPDGKNGQDVHNGAKARRAEMERYVPKPIAKELSLQGDSQHSSPLVAPVSSANIVGKPDSALTSLVSGEDVNSLVEKTAMTSINTEEKKQNRQGKTRASWRQRNSFEHNMDGNNLSFDSSKCVEKASELQHQRSTDDMHDEGGNGALEETLTPTSGIVKNNGVGRQRRQQYKDHRVDRSSYAPTHSKVMQGEISDKREVQSLGPSESGERNHSRNEIQSAGSVQMRSHWQPKSQVHPQNSLHDYKDSGGQKAAESLLPSQNKDKNYDDSDFFDHGKKVEDNSKYQAGYSGKKVLTDDGKHQENTKGRKVTKQPSKDENKSIDQDLTGITEAAAADANSYWEIPGTHRRGYDRSHVARGDATYAGRQKARPDARNAEQNIDYQTGFGNKGGDMFHQKFSGSAVADAHRVSSGARYGMHGHDNSRRGSHFYGPHRGPAVRATNAYDIEG